MSPAFRTCAATAAALLALLAAGCASRIPAGRPAYVYVADNAVVTFRGETLKAKELPERLKKAGATPQTQIFLIAQGDVPSAYLSELAMLCGRAGLPDCAIRERMKISVEKPSAVVHDVNAPMREELSEKKGKDAAQ